MKLTDEDIERIRKLAKPGMTRTVLGKRFGVSPNTISDIVLGKIRIKKSRYHRCGDGK